MIRQTFLVLATCSWNVIPWRKLTHANLWKSRDNSRGISESATSMLAERILLVAYDSLLGETCSLFLRGHGYAPVAVLSNEEAMARVPSANCKVFVVGSSAPFPVREKLIQWLKQQSPTTPIVALCQKQEVFAEADYHASSESPTTWLAAVARCCQRSA